MSSIPFPIRRVLLGVTGSVAAAHVPAIVLTLRQLYPVEIKAVLTTAASAFVTPKALALATGNPVVTDETFRAPSPTVDHVALTRWAELMLVLPATADVLGKAAHGLATDALTTCILAAPCPIAFVPSMNAPMWGNPAVQRNIATLRGDGRGVIPPVEGLSIGGGSMEIGAMPPLPQILTWLAGWAGNEAAADAGGSRRLTHVG